MDYPSSDGCQINDWIGERYRVVGLIGRGGMGEVYAVEDMRLQGKLRALKVNKPHLQDAHYSVEEASLLMRLNHPQLPVIVDYYPPNDAGIEMMVMDYIDGETIHSYTTSQGGEITIEMVLHIGMQLCEALHYLHQQQPAIIHRDLKPTNVMITRSGHIRLIDFGIARRYKVNQQQDTVQLGTPGFAAPEQEGEQQSDARTDIYGLGALLFYMLNRGRTPSASDKQQRSLLHKANVPQSVIAVIERMMDERPNCRLSSMAEVRAALLACLQVQEQNMGSPHYFGPIAQTEQTRHARVPGMGDSSFADRARNKPVQVAVASLSSGSGATFTALTLVNLLGLRGISCGAVEHPALEPEWHALLDLGGKRGAVSAVMPQDPRYIRVLSENLMWHALEPTYRNDEADLAIKNRLMLESLTQTIVVTDISSRWVGKEGEELLLRADILLLVADPCPAKWTPQRLQSSTAVCFERERLNRTTMWIANKDVPFSHRGEWLRLIPSKPVTSIPQLPSAEWTQFMWQGAWATKHKSWLPMLERAFEPIFNKLFA
ncbi:Serine/threonine-protein kinase PknD [Paenibacillus plantiphilus]|uniref:Serine/threonine-protein kinase PknD n=1 Tax=Paenibacillus plantiphilus TaxID=2905650 RepID=A0ABN8FYW4_9BACL|nr:serine/threonine-protein kinase [Paenibacillus plantiphilus]CAH1194954.1 Serine/threonine-protein kinase PknD [Paenibacillus plantiphilus]